MQALQTRQPLRIDLQRIVLWAGAGLVATSIAEFLLLRLFTRTAIHIPGIQELTTVYTLLAETGRLGYFAATVLLAGLLFTLGPTIARTRSWAGGIAAAGLAFYGIVAALASLGAIDDTPLAVCSLVAVLSLTPWASQHLPRAGVIPIALYGSAFSLAALFAIGQSTADAVLRDSDLLLIAEASALGFAALAPLLIPRTNAGRDRAAMAFALFVGLITTAALIGNESTSKVLALWSVGLAGYFPALVYGVAAAGATYTAVASWRAGRPLLAVGLVLILLAGVGLHSTYQTGLAVVGLAFIGAGARLAPTTAPVQPAPDQPATQAALPAPIRATDH
jgi:hypothetical protein